jgi:hypothetical protein
MAFDLSSTSLNLGLLFAREADEFDLIDLNHRGAEKGDRQVGGIESSGAIRSAWNADWGP